MYHLFKQACFIVIIIIMMRRGKKPDVKEDTNEGVN